MPRTKIIMEPEQVQKLAEMAATYEEMAAFFNCSETTITYRLSRGPLREAYEKGRARASISLKRAMFQSALNGNVTAQIWVSKNVCGWSDKVEQKVEQATSFVVEIPAPMGEQDWIRTFGRQEALPAPEPK